LEAELAKQTEYVEVLKKLADKLNAQLASREAALERAQAAPSPRYASSETFLEALTEQVAALRKMQSEPTNRQCVAEEFLETALSLGYNFKDAAQRLRDAANAASIYRSYTGILFRMADVLERAARGEGE